MKIAITGHRPNKLGNDYDLVSPLIKNIERELIRIVNEYKPEALISGMALGIDTLWAKVAIELGIPLIAAIPCKGHSSKWPQKSVNVYNKILSYPSATVVMVSDKEYDNTCMQKRNEYMVDNSDVLIAIWNGTPGGTSNCVKYAEKQNKTIIRINPDEFVFN